MLLTPTLERTELELTFPDLNTWIQRYLRDCRRELRQPTTLIHYSNALKRFRLWYETDLPDQRISKDTARDFTFWLARIKKKYDDHPGRPTEVDPLSPTTVKRTVGVVRTFLRWLFNEGYLPYELVSWFPLPETPSVPTRVIEVETLQALFHGAIRGHMPIRDTAMIALLADTGLRRSEITHLEVSQIRWLDGGPSGYLYKVLGKAGKLRDVPFSATAGQVLREWLAVRPGELSDKNDQRKLFLQPNGQPLTVSGIYQILRRSASRSGVTMETWNPHSMRHAFATHYWRVQRDTKTLSLILGHSSQKITEDIYVHPVPADLIESHTSLLTDHIVTVPDLSAVKSRRSPTKEELAQAIINDPNWTHLGQRFDLSDVGVRKLAIRHGLLDLFYERKNLKLA